MTDAPKRIWAFKPDIFDNASIWQDAPSPAGDTVEYIRADLVEELVQAAEEVARISLRAALRAIKETDT